MMPTNENSEVIILRIKFKSKNDFSKMILQSGHTSSSFSLLIGKCRQFIAIALKRDSLSPKSAKEICNALNKDFDDIFLIEVSSNDNKQIA